MDDWIDMPVEAGGEAGQHHIPKSRRFFYDRSLITCLVDRWRPETHTFHFAWGEMAPTLQDVSYLLGLPLAGEAIGPLEAAADWRGPMQTRFLEVVPGAGPLEHDAHGPRWTWLAKFQVNSLVLCIFLYLIDS